jgi:hypothetical protein
MGKSTGHGTTQSERREEIVLPSPGASTTGTENGPSAEIRLLLIEDSQDDVALTRRAFKSAAPHIAIESVARGRQAI